MDQEVIVIPDDEVIVIPEDSGNVEIIDLTVEETEKKYSYTEEDMAREREAIYGTDAWFGVEDKSL